jgi:hypothetical protein
MKNLAGDKTCDTEIFRELTEAKIPIVQVDRVDREVSYTLTGKLGELIFRRAWYYWVVTGPVPLAIAKKLYEHPIGERNVRVDGHCGCPPPEDPWLSYFDAEGNELLHSRDRDQFDRLQWELPPGQRWSDDPEGEGEAFVMSYHIDSQEGLNLFAETMRGV